MNHYDAVLGAPDEHERKIALDKLVAELTEPLGFEEWWQDGGGGIYGKEDGIKAYQAGRNRQREADARTILEWITRQTATEYHVHAPIVRRIAKAIRNQGE